MKPDPTGGPRQPRHHHLGVVIAGVVEKHMDHPLGRIVGLDHRQKCDQGRGVDRQLVAHEGGARLQVDRAMDVEAVPAAGLIDGDLGVLGRPAADRPDAVRGMDGVDEQRGLVVAHGPLNGLVSVDERPLTRRIELARDGLGLAIGQSQPVQQGRQSAAALVDDPELPFDPGADLVRRARQRLSHPSLERVLLRRGQRTGAPLVVELLQALDAGFLETAMPRPDRVVVDQQHPADLVATHPTIPQHQRVCPPGQTMPRQPVPSQLGQVPPFLRCQKAAANHDAEKNPSTPVWQAVFSTSHGVAVYSEDRTYDRPKPQLAGFSGVLQVDGWGGFKRLTGDKDAGALILAFCWSHARRQFYEIHQATQSPIAGEVIARIAALYRIEDAIRGRPPDERVALRQRESRPKVAALKVYLETQLGRISGKSTLATAIRYALNHWDGLCVFLSDGRVEIDTNTIERLHRSVATGRRNALFAGSDAGARSWAIFTSLIQSARLNGLDPFAYLKDVLEQIVSGRVKNHELARLLPWNWKAAQSVAPAA